MEIRPCTPDDVPWILKRAKIAFGSIVNGYDEKGAEAWIDYAIRAPDMICMRGEYVVGFGSVLRLPWAPTVGVCDLVHLFGKSPRGQAWEAIDVTRVIRDRCFEMGCLEMYIGSAYADLSVVGAELGGKPTSMTYVLKAGNRETSGV